ncbi:ABC transporter permease [Anaerosporobacter sp.]|uniref:ABC transporter permease n=1 Tax=Anaerosporobacter sp. TaxID=1872529 RepID=UPI00286F631D|nr:ABC transporter permease [Anaerosporobacter sp.]
MNIKLLLRNKAFLFFLCLTPLVSALILGIKADFKLYTEEAEEIHIIELDDCSDRAVYVSDTSAFVVKVYDSSQTELSEYVLEQLAYSGMFSICRSDTSKMTEEEVLKQAKSDAFDDRAGTLLYLKEDFDTCVLAGDYANALQIYDVSDDERWVLFETEISSLLSKIHQVSANTGMDTDTVLRVLRSLAEEMPEKEVVSLSGKEEIALTNEQRAYKSPIGYAFAIITLGFLFCGVCVAHTVIEEQDNKVYTRLMLSKLSQSEYLCSKLAMSVIISIMQTLILGIYMFVVKDMNFGISKLNFLVIIFFLGLIFSTLSFVIGVLLGDVMSSNYAVFSVWTISALLSGMYFPIDSSSVTIKALSNLMPQRWFMKAAEMLFVGDNSVYSMILCITVAYLIVIMSIGGIGLKIKRGNV